MLPERTPEDSGRYGASGAGERPIFELPPAERRRRRELVMSIVALALLAGHAFARASRSRKIEALGIEVERG